MKWPLLGALYDEAAAAVLASTVVKEFGRGELVLFEVDRSKSLYLVNARHVAVRVTTLDGDTAMCGRW